MSTPQPVNILLVDDRPENLHALEVVLEGLGQNLVLARSGKEALRALLKDDFAVILLDVQMPEMDGFETAALIRARDRSKHTPIIFLTAIDKSEEHVRRGYSTGAVDYIFKPFNPEILKSKVTVFVDLYQMREQIRLQVEQMENLNRELERRALDLEVVNKELEAFSYSVSHDLRAPLRAVTGFSSALLEDYKDKVNAEGKDLLQRILAATGKMNEMIEGLLDLARISRGDLRRGIVDLSAMVHEIAAGLKQSEPKRKVEFVIAEKASAAGDERMLRLVLQNLLGNAWKFTGRQPKARIEFGALTPTPTPPPSRSSAMGEGREGVVFFVKDNGVGFAPEHAKKLFVAFQRLHAQSDFPGIGVGLATAARIIHRHGGQIWAEGKVGEGAVFYFTLGD